MGLTTILVESGYGLERLEYEVFPDFVCKDLEEAVLKIKGDLWYIIKN